MMTKDFKDLLRAFNANAVKYLIIGGHALSVHSEPRTTKDLDLFIGSEPENAKAAFRALTQFGAPLQGMSEADFVDGTTFQIGQPPNRIDVLQQISGITFDEAWANRIDGSIDGEVQAPVISREDLIRNKLASGREQDLLDVKVLRAAENAVRGRSAQSENAGRKP
jgi:predicted nucleotidyltransferase